LEKKVMLHDQQSTKWYDWSDLPSIPAYSEDEEPLMLEQKLWYGSLLVILTGGILLLNFQIHPLPAWWMWVWTTLFGGLCLRALQISSSWKQRVWPISFALAFILAWWVLPLSFPDRSGHFWPIIWPLLLGGLTIWLNFRSGLLPWWWHWTRPILLMALLVLVGFLVGRFSR
jgi:hypothetical protein